MVVVPPPARDGLRRPVRHALAPLCGPGAHRTPTSHLVKPSRHDVARNREVGLEEPAREVQADRFAGVEGQHDRSGVSAERRAVVANGVARAVRATGRARAASCRRRRRRSGPSGRRRESGCRVPGSRSPPRSRRVADACETMIGVAGVSPATWSTRRKAMSGPSWSSMWRISRSSNVRLSSRSTSSRKSIEARIALPSSPSRKMKLVPRARPNSAATCRFVTIVSGATSQPVPSQPRLWPTTSILPTARAAFMRCVRAIVSRDIHTSLSGSSNVNCASSRLIASTGRPVRLTIVSATSSSPGSSNASPSAAAPGAAPRSGPGRDLASRRSAP